MMTILFYNVAKQKTFGSLFWKWIWWGISPADGHCQWPGAEVGSAQQRDGGDAGAGGWGDHSGRGGALCDQVEHRDDLMVDANLILILGWSVTRMAGCCKSMMNQNIPLSSINSLQLSSSHWESRGKLKYHLLDLEKRVHYFVTICNLLGHGIWSFGPGLDIFTKMVL